VDLEEHTPLSLLSPSPQCDIPTRHARFAFVIHPLVRADDVSDVARHRGDDVDLRDARSDALCAIPKHVSSNRLLPPNGRLGHRIDDDIIGPMRQESVDVTDDDRPPAACRVSISA
jgi:hypothetical protein